MLLDIFLKTFVGYLMKYWPNMNIVFLLIEYRPGSMLRMFILEL